MNFPFFLHAFAYYKKAELPYREFIIFLFRFFIHLLTAGAYERGKNGVQHLRSLAMSIEMKRKITLHSIEV